MVSVDAGIWLAFLRNEASAEPLRKLLQEERVSVHPFVLMELRLGVRGPQRARILGDLERLVACAVDPPEVVSAFIEERDLAASQVDLVGAHLLVSAIRHGDQLWTTESALRATAVHLEVAFPPPGRQGDSG